MVLSILQGLERLSKGEVAGDFECGKVQPLDDVDIFSVRAIDLILKAGDKKIAVYVDQLVLISQRRV